MRSLHLISNWLRTPNLQYRNVSRTKLSESVYYTSGATCRTKPKRYCLNNCFLGSRSVTPECAWNVTRFVLYNRCFAYTRILYFERDLEFLISTLFGNFKRLKYIGRVTTIPLYSPGRAEGAKKKWQKSYIYIYAHTRRRFSIRASDVTWRDVTWHTTRRVLCLQRSGCRDHRRV